MKLHTRTVEPVPKDRVDAVSNAVHALMQNVPDGAVRIEIDIEWSDGGRVKLEARA